MARRLGAATGRTVRYVPVRRGVAADATRASGAADFAVATALAHLEYWRTGVGADVNRTASRLLGRPPRTFATFASDHVTLFAAEDRRIGHG